VAYFKLFAQGSLNVDATLSGGSGSFSGSASYGFNGVGTTQTNTVDANDSSGVSNNQQDRLVSKFRGNLYIPFLQNLDP